MQVESELDPCAAEIVQELSLVGVADDSRGFCFVCCSVGNDEVCAVRSNGFALVLGPDRSFAEEGNAAQFELYGEGCGVDRLEESVP
jgi:hypothetical protein